MSKQHKDIKDPQIHNPKDFDAAPTDTVLSKDSFGNLVYVPKDDVGGSQGIQGPVGPIATIQNIVTVQKNPLAGQFSTIEAALASITDNSSTNIYKIDIGPGIYVENQLTMKPYIYLVGSDTQATIIEPVDNSIPLVIGSRDCMLDRFSIRNVINSTAVHVEIGSGTFSLNYVHLIDNKIHVDVVASTGSRSKIDMFRCLTKGSSDWCIRAISTAAIQAKAVLNESVIEQQGVGDGIFLSGPLSNLIINGGEIDGEGTGNRGFVIEDGGLIESFGCEIERWKTGFITNNVGLAPHLVMSSTLFENNAIKDFQLDHSGTTGSLTGTAIEAKSSKHDNAPISLFYVDPVDNGIITIGKFKIGANHSQLVDASKLIQQGFPSGLLGGGVLSVITGLQIQITAGNGFIETGIAPNDHLQEVNWLQQTIVVPDNIASYLYIDNTNTLQSSNTLPAQRNNVIFGRVGAFSGTVSFIDRSPIDINHYGNKVEEYFREAIGPIYITGSQVTENVTPFQLDISLGRYHFGTTNFKPSGGTAQVFSEVFRNGLGSYIIAPSSTVLQKWDNNSGSLVSISVGKFARHSLYLIGEGADEKYFLVYGQEEFASLVSAEGGNIPTPPNEFVDSMVLIASIICDDAGTSINKIIDERPIIGFKASGISASSDHNNLTGLGVDSHIQYVLADGSRAMDALTVNGQTNINLQNTDNIVIDGATNPRAITSGVLRFLHKPTVPSTRAINMEIDANNQNDTMGMVVNYKATGLSAGDEAMVIEHNIDTDSSTGGRIAGSKISKVGAGVADVSCLNTGPGVNVVRQDSGSFLAINAAYIFDGVFTDITANLSSGVTNSPIFVNNGDVLYIGQPAKFDALEVLLNTLSSHSIGAVFEYSLGTNTWQIFGPNDNTSGFISKGIISWDKSSLINWAVDDISAATGLFWIKITRSATTVTTPPTELTIKQSSFTSYIWDANGDLNVRDVNARNLSSVGNINGRDMAADGAKLDGIETGATADQTGAEIKLAYEAEANTNAYTDAEKTKLAGIEAGATADQTGAEIKLAYEAEANTNAYTDAEKTKLAGIGAGANVVNPMTATGDIIVGGTGGNPNKLAKGTADQVLSMNGTGTSLVWKNSGALAQLTGHPINGQFVHDTVDSVGVISGFNFTDNLDGSIAVAVGEVFIKAADLPTGNIYLFTLAAPLASLVLTDLTKNYIYVQYNAGTPNIIASATELLDKRTNVLLGTVYRSGLSLYMDESVRQIVSDHSALQAEKNSKVDSVKLEKNGGALIGTNIALLNSVTVSIGNWWNGLSKYSTVAFDSSGIDTFDTYLMSAFISPALPTWTKSVAPVSALNIINYRNPLTGTLALLTAPVIPPLVTTLPTYSPRWVYQGSDGRIGVVYGDGYLSIEEAVNEPNLPHLPPELQDAQLVGMFVVSTLGIEKTIQLAGIKRKPILMKTSNIAQTFSIIGVVVDIIDMQITPPEGNYLVTFSSVTDDNGGRTGVFYEFAISQALTPAILTPIPNTRRPVYVQRALMPKSNTFQSVVYLDGTETLHVTGSYSDPQGKGPSIITSTTRSITLMKLGD